MKLTNVDRNGVRIVTVHDDRIDAAAVVQFKESMRRAIQNAPGRVILDLSRVAFIDSSGLGAIVATMKQMPDGQRLDLSGLTPVVEKVFRLTRMDTVFRLFPTTDAALSARAA